MFHYVVLLLFSLFHHSLLLWKKPFHFIALPCFSLIITRFSLLASVVKGKIIATNSRTAHRRYTNIRYVLLCSPSVRQILPIITALFLCKTVQKPFLCGLIITHFCCCHYFFWSLTFVTAHTSFHVYLFHVYLFLLYVFPPNSEQETTVFLGLEQKFGYWGVRLPTASANTLYIRHILWE